MSRPNLPYQNQSNQPPHAPGVSDRLPGMSMHSGSPKGGSPGASGMGSQFRGQPAMDHGSDAYSETDCPEAEGLPMDVVTKATVEEQLARKKAKYIERAQEKKVEMYFKALDVARLREGQDSRVYDVTFKMNFSSSYGQDLCIVGGAPELGNWDPSKAEILTWTEGNNWIGHVRLTGASEIEYKYIVKKGDQVHWEWGNNHVINLAKVESNITVIDTWGAGMGK